MMEGQIRAATDEDRKNMVCSFCKRSVKINGGMITRVHRDHLGDTKVHRCANAKDCLEEVYRITLPPSI
jgi:hypothetical protein